MADLFNIIGSSSSCGTCVDSSCTTCGTSLAKPKPRSEISRRQFGGTVLGASAAALLAGCTTKKSAETPTEDSSQTAPAPALSPDLEVAKQSKGPIMTVLEEFYKMGPGPSSSHTMGPMRRSWGDDGAIACCVSPMLVGKQMQFFGARANLAKCLLYAINGGRDEITGQQVGPALPAVQGEYLDIDDVLGKFETMMDWLAGVYVNAMNVIHYMHDKYAYERVEMALHDYAPMRTMAFGIAGLSVIADSLSAIRYAKVKILRDETDLVTDYQIEGAFPQFGNNDNKVDQLATWVVSTFMGDASYAAAATCTET